MSVLGRPPPAVKAGHGTDLVRAADANVVGHQGLEEPVGAENLIWPVHATRWYSLISPPRTPFVVGGPDRDRRWDPEASPDIVEPAGPRHGAVDGHCRERRIQLEPAMGGVGRR